MNDGHSLTPLQVNQPVVLKKITPVPDDKVNGLCYGELEKTLFYKDCKRERARERERERGWGGGQTETKTERQTDRQTEKGRKRQRQRDSNSNSKTILQGL